MHLCIGIGGKFHNWDVGDQIMKMKESWISFREILSATRLCMPDATDITLLPKQCLL